MVVVTVLLSFLCASNAACGQSVDTIRKDATSLRPLVNSKLANIWLDQAAALPSISSRTVYRDETTRKYYSKSDADKLEDTKRAAQKAVSLDERFYYYTKYGSPLAYVRPLEILG